MPKIRRTVLYLGREFDTDHPLIHSDMWTDGVNVFVEHYGHLVNASKEGQLAMRQLLDAHLHRIDRDLNGVAVRLFPFTRKRGVVPTELVQEPRIISIDPEVA